MMMQNTRTLSAQILTFNTLPTLLFEAVKGSKPAVGSTLITAENRLASSFFPAKSVVVQFKPLNKTRVKSSIQIRKEVIVSTTAISS